MPSSDQSSVDYVDHDLVADETIEKRGYQMELADAALSQSTLVVLPTGTGKTEVAMLVAAHRLSEHRGKRALVLAPTKPLVDQHAETFREVLDIPDHEVKVFTGDTRPDSREELWSEPASVVVATPKVIENDLIADRISLQDVVHLVFDECHRATGEYPYTYVAERYWQQGENPLVTGLSASPGSDESQIMTVCENIGVTSVEVVTEEDADLEEYTAETSHQTIKVNLDGKYEEIRDCLDCDRYTEVLKELKDIGVLNTRSKSKMSSGRLQQARTRASELINKDDSDGYRAQSLLSEARKFLDAINAIETQGIEEVARKFDRWQEESRSGKSKAVTRFLNNSNVQQSLRLIEECDDPHPKMEALRPEVIATHRQGGRVLVFTESRRMASRLAEFLSLGDINANRFVGQSNNDGDKGMSQSEQAEVLDQFRAGDIDVLVSTSVAEEGLDIPSVDLVAVYEPVSEAIRRIQRRGRTGRQSAGEVVILMTKNSRDEGRYYASKRREDRMKEDLNKLKEMEGDLNDRLGAAQAELTEFSGGTSESEGSETTPSAGEVDEMSNDDEEDDVEMPDVDTSGDKLEIVVDNREMKSSVVKTLSKHPDVSIRTENLEVGDYVVSERCAVERKSTDDFISTLTGGERNMFEQIGDLTREYSRPILLIEGDVDDLYTQGVHENAIRGALTAAVLGMGVRPLNSRDEDDTAEYLITLARREQEERDQDVSAHGKKSTKSLSEQQEYIVSSIVDIGPKKAKTLLQEFGTVRSVLTASEQELMKVDGIGETTAEQINRVLESEYEPK